METTDSWIRFTTECEFVQQVPSRWKKAYSQNGDYGFGNDTREQAYQRLVALPPHATAHDVEQIVGNDTWVGASCKACNNWTVEVCEVGDPPGYDNDTIRLCPSCAAILAQTLEAWVRKVKGA
jgi:hypothetical protein